MELVSKAAESLAEGDIVERGKPAIFSYPSFGSLEILFSKNLKPQREKSSNYIYADKPFWYDRNMYVYFLV